jgi:hypothetical protein
MGLVFLDPSILTGDTCLGQPSSSCAPFFEDCELDTIDPDSDDSPALPSIVMDSQTHKNLIAPKAIKSQNPN